MMSLSKYTVDALLFILSNVSTASPIRQNQGDEFRVDAVCDAGKGDEESYVSCLALSERKLQYFFLFLFGLTIFLSSERSTRLLGRSSMSCTSM